MKKFKKLISFVCATSMIATLFASTFTAHAEYDAPTLYADVTTYDKTTGEGTITVSVEKLLTGEFEYAFMNTFALTVGFDSSEFDVTYYNDDAGYDYIFPGDDVKDDLTLSSNYGEDAKGNKGIVVGYAPTAARKWTNANVFDTKNTLFTFDFKVLYPTKSATVNFNNNEITVNVMSGSNYSSTVQQTVFYGTSERPLNIVNNVNDTLKVESATATPTATATATPTPTPTPTVEPTPVAPTSGNGEITTDQSGSAKDAAVWAWKELTGNGNKVNVTINAAGNVLTKEFTLGANVETEGAAKVGIVIQYDPAKIGGKVSVTDISLVTAN